MVWFLSIWLVGLFQIEWDLIPLSSKFHKNYHYKIFHMKWQLWYLQWFAAKVNFPSNLNEELNVVSEVGCYTVFEFPLRIRFLYLSFFTATEPLTCLVAPTWCECRTPKIGVTLGFVMVLDWKQSIHLWAINLTTSILECVDIGMSFPYVMLLIDWLNIFISSFLTSQIKYNSIDQ